MSGPEYHLLDPSEYQLHIDPSLAPIPSPDATPGLGGYNAGAGMVDDFYHSSLFPSPSSLLGPGGVPGASFDLFEHYTDPPAPAAPGLSLPTLPFGLEADGDGVGGTVGDWSLRFMPYIPGLNEPESPEMEELRRRQQGE
ncbi:MAG: hypothetical protein AB7T06_19685 [Kofleriaceae bacterium]